MKSKEVESEDAFFGATKEWYKRKNKKLVLTERGDVESGPFLLVDYEF